MQRSRNQPQKQPKKGLHTSRIHTIPSLASSPFPPHSDPSPLHPLPPCSASKLAKSSSSDSLHAAVAAADGSHSLAPTRGKARRKTLDDDAALDDDALSTTSTSSTSSSVDLTAPIPPSALLSPSSNRLHDILEALPEKRSSIRVAALEQLVDLLTSHYAHDSLARQVETLTMYTLQCIKRGDTKEVELACRTLCLIAVSCTEGGRLGVQGGLAHPARLDEESGAQLGRAGSGGAGAHLPLLHPRTAPR